MNENELDELYFKNAFDLTDDSLSLTIDKLKVNCITSNENNFSLDNQGNLLVNTIQTKTESDSQIDLDVIFEAIYPIGSIYLSINNVNPSALFKGTWISWGNGRVPVGVDTSQSEFNTIEKTGGNKHMQNHLHYLASTIDPNGTVLFPAYTGKDGGVATTVPAKGYATVTSSAGDGHSGNLPPYITCYMWKRIA